MDASHNRRQVMALSTGLLTLLIAVYLLSYSGVFNSGDEIYYFNQATDLVLGNALTIEKGGPHVIAMAAIFALTRDVEQIGPLQTMFLINVATTAGAALFVFLLGIELGYGKRIALLVALLYALTTPAWVYTKYLFREPWAAVGLAGAMYFLIRFRHHALIRDVLFSLICLAIAVTARTSVATFAPFGVLYAFLATREHAGKPDPKIQQRLKIMFALTVLSGIILVALALNDYSGYVLSLLKDFIPIDHLVIPLAGLLISPGRGLFLFAPIMVIALIGLPRFYRDHPRETWVVIGSFIPYLIMFSLERMWWGGWNWGPRYLVPFLPLLILPTLAVLHAIIVERRMRWLAIGLVLLGLTGVLVQVLGVVFSTRTPTNYGISSTADAFKMSVSPFSWMMFAWQSIPIDLAWLNMEGTWKASASVVIPALLLAMAGVVVLIKSSRSVPSRGKLVATTFGLVALVIVLVVWSLVKYSSLDRRYLAASGLGTAIGQVVENQQDGDILVMDYWSSEDSHIVPSRILNFCRGKCPPVEAVAREPWPTRQDKKEWLDDLMASYSRIWLIPIGVSSGDPSSVVEAFLDENVYKVNCDWAGTSMRLCRYLTGGNDDFASLSGSPDVRLGDSIALRSIELAWLGGHSNTYAGSIAIQAGAPILIGLEWQALDPIQDRFKVSIQVLDEQNNVMHQIDREPQDGFRPTSSWHAEEIVVDRFAFELPSDLSPGTYQIILAMYDPVSGDRLPIWNQAESASNNQVLLAKIDVS